MRTDTSITKELAGIYQAGSRHMVGDGFPVRNMIPGAGVDEQLSPFLLLDYLGPEQFPPTTRQPGVGEHPTVDLRRSRSCITARWRIVIRPGAEVSLVLAMCSG